ncbi:MAG: hypothetical protein K1X57_09795 [Gemmataceae bacterium]|nr:hypothetical protein [Gemmataceae bacterium]
MSANTEPASEIRRRVLTGGLSKRQGYEQYRIQWKTLVKILAHEESPECRWSRPARRLKI